MIARAAIEESRLFDGKFSAKRGAAFHPPGI